VRSEHAGLLRRFLLETGERELVEASGTDCLWGAGITTSAAERHTGKWPGLNLLGQALMEVRADLRAQSVAARTLDPGTARRKLLWSEFEDGSEGGEQFGMRAKRMRR
jgi:hypothetical protein